MDLGIRGRTALVSGADSGIGWQTARLLLAEGVTVVITDIEQTALDEAAAKLEAPAGRLFAFAADVTDVTELDRLHDRVVEAVGDIDILVQSAGITVDLLGPVRLTKAFLPSLRTGGWGRIVYLTSEDALQPYDDELPYCAAKAGVLSMAKGLSRSYATEGLLVNTVSPAFIHTPMTDQMMSKRADQRGTDIDEAIESFLEEERPYMELKRRGEPEEVADVIVFLCSDRASFVNGANYRVDSGSVATIG